MKGQVVRAWCEETQEVIDIEQAHQRSVAESPPLKFTFRCSNPTCRALKNPLVAGVNYRENLVEGDKRRTRHFRVVAPHMPGCPEIISLVKKRRRRDEPVSADVSKTANDITRFEAKLNDGPSGQRPGSSVTVQQIEPGERQPRPRGDGQTQTHRIDKLLQVYDRLGSTERRVAAPLYLASQPMTFDAAFVFPRTISPSDSGHRILLGFIRLDHLAGDKTLVFKFFKPLQQFPEHEGSRDLYIELPWHRLEASARGRQLMTRLLLDGVPRKEGLRCAVLGDLLPRDKGGYEVHVASLFSLEVQPTTSTSGGSANMTIKAAKARA
jgi:hypothetical protein